jgi:hypothetical protein
VEEHGISIFRVKKQNHTTRLITRKNFFTSIVLFTGKTSNCVKSHIIDSTGRTTEGNKPTQLTTNQRAGSGPENGASTGINTRMGRPPDPHQLNDPEDEDRDGLRNVGIYESRTTLPG